jgi:hypothetical protein
MGRCKGWGNKSLKSLNKSSTPLGSKVVTFVCIMGYYIMAGVVSLTYIQSECGQLDDPHRSHATGWRLSVRGRALLHSIFQVMPSTPAYVLDSDETWYTRGRSDHLSAQWICSQWQCDRSRTRQARTTTTPLKKNISHGYVNIYNIEICINSCIFSWFNWEWIKNVQNHGFTYDVGLVDVKITIGSTSLVGWVLRVTKLLHHNYFMGETRDGYIKTRIIRTQ